MAVFDVSQRVVNNAAGLIGANSGVSESMLANLETTLQSMGTGALLGLWMQSLLIQITVVALNIAN
jgi:hypothetical protein